MSNLSKGIIAIIISALGFTLMAFFVKLSGDLPITQKVIFRNAIAMLISGYFVYQYKANLFGNKVNRVNLILRAIFGMVGIILNFYSIDHLLLSDADMLSKLSPFFLIFLSSWILKEKISRITFLVCLLSLIGVLFIVKSGFNFSTFPYVIGLIGAFFSALAYLMLRVLSLSAKPESPYTIVFFFSLFSTLIILPVVIVNWQAMSFIQYGYLILSGIGATIGQFGITYAYRFASAKEVSIYSYSSAIFAAILSIIVFNQYPDIWSWLGYLLIFLSGLWLYRLNRR